MNAETLYIGMKTTPVNGEKPRPPRGLRSLVVGLSHITRRNFVPPGAALPGLGSGPENALHRSPFR